MRFKYSLLIILLSLALLVGCKKKEPPHHEHEGHEHQIEYGQDHL